MCECFCLLIVSRKQSCYDCKRCVVFKEKLLMICITNNVFFCNQGAPTRVSKKMREEQARRKLKQNETSRIRMTNARARQNVLSTEQVQIPTLQIPCISEQHLQQAIVAFEKANAQLAYLHCQVCHQIRLDWKVVPITFDRKRLMCCNKCKNLKQVDMDKSINNGCLLGRTATTRSTMKFQESWLF